MIKDKNLYYVGGVVRDEFLNIPSVDIDLCYEGNALDFAQNLEIIKINPDFGTVRVLYNNNEIDIASTRNEKYPKAGHLPCVEKIGCPLLDDLARRDFTINAIAKNTVTNDFFDPFNGIKDIKEKKLRILHNNSFIDDPTRIVRGLKFSIRFGFELEENTKNLQEKYLENINYDISYHRLKKELKETFNLNKIEAFNRFIDQKIYKLLGENQIAYKINPKIESFINKYKPQNIWLIYLAQFNLLNLELNSQEANIIKSYKLLTEKEKPVKDIEIYNCFKNQPLESILLYALNDDECIATKYLDKLSKIKLEITGKDLQKLNIPQSEMYNKIFEEILKLKFEQPNLKKNDELNIVKNLFI